MCKGSLTQFQHAFYLLILFHGSQEFHQKEGEAGDEDEEDLEVEVGVKEEEEEEEVVSLSLMFKECFVHAMAHGLTSELCRLLQ